MSELLTLPELALNKELRKDPKQIAEMIIEVAEAIESCKNDLCEIQDRGFFTRLINNNTRDLATIILKQNETISIFLNIIQTIIVLNMGNTFMLGAIQQELAKQEQARGKFNNKYLMMAQEMFDESYQAALNSRNHIENLESKISSLEKSNKRAGFFNGIACLAAVVFSILLFVKL